ncbi:hypothetical protein F5Y14DRAFT_85193 [Nemania sp. NC0429]|nr:hypothetical protein F5Y14DRAFT_85193 [Nemania sp. NC0429]
MRAGRVALLVRPILSTTVTCKMLRRRVFTQLCSHCQRCLSTLILGHSPLAPPLCTSGPCLRIANKFLCLGNQLHAIGRGGTNLYAPRIIQRRGGGSGTTVLVTKLGMILARYTISRVPRYSSSSRMVGQGYPSIRTR